MSGTMPVSPTVRLAWAEEAEAQHSLWLRAVDTLTRAARLTRTSVGGQVERADFAAFLASAVGAVAANLGDPDLVTAGRPGSWEADLVDQLVRGTVGCDPARLWQHRVEPVVVPLNVAQLVDDTGCLVSFFEAEAMLPFSLDLDENTQDTDWERLRARYLDGYTAYAAAFSAAVRAHALTIDGLAVRTEDGDSFDTVVPVFVRVEVEPDRAWGEFDNPIEWDGDPVVWRLWQQAVDTVGFPQLADDSPRPE